MTRQSMPSICDFCGKEIHTEMEYKLQISQKGKKGTTKGKFIKAQNNADMCHVCFLEVCKNGYKPDWVALVKNESTGKWDMAPMEEDD